jgi:hypothetical protein
MLAVVAGLGLASRKFPIGWFFWDKSVGDVCYAAGVFFIFSLLLSHSRRAHAAVAALGFCLAIECFKLTGWPLRWQGNPVLRIIFGSTFSWHNILCYCLGIAVMLGFETIFD